MANTPEVERKQTQKTERKRDADLQINDCPANWCKSIYLSLNAQEKSQNREESQIRQAFI